MNECLVTLVRYGIHIGKTILVFNKVVDKYNSSLVFFTLYQKLI